MHTDILSATAALKNSKTLIVHTSWNWEVLHSVLEGTKDRIPAMSDALLKFTDKYHKNHFGFDLNRGSMMLKNALSNVIEKVYHDISVSLTNLHISMTYFIENGRDVYWTASDRFMSVRMQNIIETLSLHSGKVVKYTQHQFHYILHVVQYILTHAKYSMPGREEFSVLQILQRAHQSVSRATGRLFQSFASCLREICAYIRQVCFILTGSDVGIDGNDILDEAISSVNFVYDQLRLLAHKGLHYMHRLVNYFASLMAEKGEDLLLYLQDENAVIALKLDAIHKDITQSTQEYHTVVNITLNQYNELSKMKINQAYEALNMEWLNNNTRQVITVFQSRLYGGLNKLEYLIEQSSPSTARYVKVNNNNMDVEIPLPFYWGSFSEWPRPLRF